jgi:hypothetical protein
LTLFAPTNEVFSALDIQLGMPMEASILLYHIVSELIEPLKNGKVYTTLNGANVAITIMGTESSVNDVNIDDNIEASNGLVYVIDVVMMPGARPALTPESGPAPLTPLPPTKAPPTPLPPIKAPPTNIPPTNVPLMPLPPTKQGSSESRIFDPRFLC